MPERITKTADKKLLDRQQWWYEQVDSEVRPQNVYRKSPTELSYDKVPGSACTSAARIMIAAHEWLHDELSADAVDLRPYVAYLRTTALPSLPPLELNTRVRLDRMLDKWLPAQQPCTARLIHGDLTFENTVLTPENKIVFIDPGFARGALVPEADHGKLLQSCATLWEERAAQKLEPADVKENVHQTWASKLDVAFCVTHWLRLYRHQARRPWLQQAAPHQLKWLLEWWEGMA